MTALSLSCLLLIFGGHGSLACPHLCTCQGTQVDCSSRSLTSASMPSSFPTGTTELRLHDNSSSTLPNGLSDDSTSSRSISLHGNPWICDCGILYSRAWSRRQPTDLASHLGVNCSSPPGSRGRAVVYSTEEEVSESCHYWYCNSASVSSGSSISFVVVQAASSVALIVFSKRFERSSKEAKRTTEETFTDGHRENDYERLKDSSI